ncbi:hypothetical protein [Sphingobium sp. TCM1]|uniref:hypothetical protein n=1 Tax=Sphingobium sp. TCM1 TaxID=453246 RepID=UPI0007F410A4|nr:hypothetical protein [Sphingobium sp. TCM1]OAN52686.1 hypothetical protein A7Q26_07740 [Sphingobium sp. TCM1]
MRNALIVFLVAMLIWFGVTIVRLENYRYAASLGMCDQYIGLSLHRRDACLNGKETRTNWVYNLLYGLRLI